MPTLDKKIDRHIIELLFLCGLAGYDDFARALIEADGKYLTRPRLERLFAPLLEKYPELRYGETADAPAPSGRPKRRRGKTTSR